MGFPEVPPGEKAFTERDADAMRTVVALRELGIVDEDTLLIVARSMGQGMARMAEAQVDVFRTLSDGMTLDEATFAASKSAREVLPRLEQLVVHVWRRQFAAATERSFATLLGDGHPMLAVGFVDLVGFTPLAQELSARELLDVITSLEARAFDVAAASGGRVVKHIGDEIMVVALDAVSGCETVLALMRDLDARGIAPHGGLSFGEVVTRHGDYYGPVVNLASRLSDEAIPGEILVDPGVADAVAVEGLVFEPAGRRMLKGFSEPVRVSTLVDRR
jgi:adenylate cyclase